MLSHPTNLIAAMLVVLGANLMHVPALRAAEPPYDISRIAGVAIGGYDAVSYFSQKQPLKGQASLSLRHDGVEWRFATAANREAFRATPQRYIPQFGGYCSYAVAKGGLAPGDPEQWDIVDGKLYLNYDSEVRGIWNRGRSTYLPDGHANWPGVLGR